MSPGEMSPRNGAAASSSSLEQDKLLPLAAGGSAAEITPEVQDELKLKPEEVLTL
jgi:hypothetical protein